MSTEKIQRRKPFETESMQERCGDVRTGLHIRITAMLCLLLFLCTGCAGVSAGAGTDNAGVVQRTVASSAEQTEETPERNTGNVSSSGKAQEGIGTQKPENSGPDDAEPVSIRVVCSGGDLNWKSTMEDLTDSFTAENPDVNVTLMFMPEVKNRTYIERLRILAAQGEFYDILELRETDVLAQTGLLAPMPEEITALVEHEDTDGVCYGVPRYSTTLGIVYNKDIYDALGLSVPENWDEFLANCEAVRRSGTDALAIGAADLWHMKFFSNFLFRNYLVTRDGALAWSEENAAEMLSDFRALSLDGYIPKNYQDVSDSQTAQAISAGQAAMVYTGPWMLPQIQSLNPPIRLGFFFLPGRDGTAYAMNDDNVAWGISAQTAEDAEKEAAAIRFLRYFYSEGHYEKVLEQMNAESVTVRPVSMQDTENQRIMQEAWDRHPVKTSLSPEDMGAPDGFASYFDQVLLDALWGEKTIPALASGLVNSWEEQE